MLLTIIKLAGCLLNVTLALVLKVQCVYQVHLGCLWLCLITTDSLRALNSKQAVSKSQFKDWLLLLSGVLGEVES